MKPLQYPKFYIYQRIVQAKLFIDNHYSDNIDLDNISDQAYFSKFHFIRLFKKIYGKTPYQYLTAVRINNAVQLLRAGNAVSDVCFAVGFESVSSFGMLFKRLMRQSPSLFLAEQQKLQSQINASPLHFVPGCFAYQHGWAENSNFQIAAF